tara:strand:+ start:8453 stop:8623 length:171 start_codon:yes stop_codon:yes gene_type:complete
MNEYEFKQKLAITLAGNPEFIKAAANSYDGKHVWHCVSEQINTTISQVNIPVPSKE